MLPVHRGFLHYAVSLKSSHFVIVIRRGNNYSVFRINQNYNILNNKNKVLVCDVCTRCFAISVFNCVKSHLGQGLQQAYDFALAVRDSQQTHPWNLPLAVAVGNEV